MRYRLATCPDATEDTPASPSTATAPTDTPRTTTNHAPTSTFAMVGLSVGPAADLRIYATSAAAPANCAE